MCYPFKSTPSGSTGGKTKPKEWLVSLP
jgi:hypothetical protein